ncbi:hypothetical protein D7V97_12960 [Corallococcus sp. CA053C]|uniref:hypothetical protein n=1 Tax=Corallococcus sp. CA053C TaxID=2316732 RepID=UPI000EA121ED|nr:hypothetical protein [Corallococcus sp. CA053C]RKH10769.1 hypothetical protein D7V97_12960 [Corallococcus sp. CA053C]
MALRLTASILGGSGGLSVVDQNGVHVYAAKDADVIMTAAILGFSAGRLAVGHPVQFDSDDPNDAKLRGAVEKLNDALGIRYSFGGAVTCGVTPPWREGAMITGAAGASRTPFAQRHATASASAALEFHDIASRDTDVGYQGRGAYTGFIDDPVENRGSIKATARFNVPVMGHGDRWRPPTYKVKGGDHNQVPWGLIAGVRELEGGMVQEPFSTPMGVVGYTHGMIQAIYDAVAHGPWCTPFEIAVGHQTTKLASCFPCTLFMYAAGYPPSSIHLGRGESWVPFYPASPGASGYSAFVDAAIQSTNTRWQLECRQHLTLGVQIMTQNNVMKTHHERLSLLKQYLSSHANDLHCAANLILDAITVHCSEVDRINQTLK